MKGWIQKEHAAESTKSLWVQGWFGSFKKWVPCVIELGNEHDLKEGKVWVHFNPPEPKPGFKLQVPVTKVMYERSHLSRYVPLSCRLAVQELISRIKETERSMAYAELG